MKTKKYVRDIFVCSCCAFTIQVLAFAILPDHITPIINDTTILQTYALVVLGSISVLIISKFDFERLWQQLAISFLALAAIVIGIGSFVFHLIPMDFIVYRSVIAVLFLVFSVTYFVVFYRNKNDAEIINQSLNKKRGK